MSKSLGTGVDPLELMDKYGTDATRYGLCGMATATQDVRLQEAREPEWDPDKPEVGRSFPFFVQGRNFANKIWNASRFAMMNLQDDTRAVPDGKTLADRWILSRYASVVESVTQSLESYRLDQATATLYDFFWSEFCDWYLEMTKPALRSDDPAVANGTRDTLAYVLENTQRLLHPFMPFITEEIWQQLPHSAGARESIMVSDWPTANAALRDEAAEARMALLMEIVGSIRKLRADQGVNPSLKVDIQIATGNDEVKALLAAEEAIIRTLTRGETLAVLPADAEVTGEQLFHQEQPVTVGISREMSPEEKQKEIEKLNRDLQKLIADRQKLADRLNNPNFVAKAPSEVVEKGRADLSEFDHRQATLEDRLKSLEG